MPELKLAWEADEVRGGVRKIPGYSGHVPGLRHTLGSTYGTCSATVLQEGSETEALKAFPSCILRHRMDGYTTPGHPDFPFQESVYRTNYGGKSRVIPGHAGHEPLWSHAYGISQGRYGSSKYQDFSTITRKLSKTLRVPTQPADVMALPPPPEPPARDPLYPNEKYYIPGTTCYAPAIRERFGHGFSVLTLNGFQEPVPRILAPLINREDGHQIDQLSLVPGYAGFRPREFPEVQRRISEILGQ